MRRHQLHVVGQDGQRVLVADEALDIYMLARLLSLNKDTADEIHVVFHESFPQRKNRPEAVLLIAMLPTSYGGRRKSR